MNQGTTGKGKRTEFEPLGNAKGSLNTDIRADLAKLADPKVKSDSERYLRGVISFHGIKSPALNSYFRELAPRILELSVPERIALARTLLRSPYAEEKGISIRILHRCRKYLGVDFLIQFESDFRTHIFDWATADTMAGKVFRHLIEQGDKNAIQQIVSWREESSLWMQRMAAVSFVWLARHGAVTNEVLSICESTIKNPERFTQLGTGWVLRELWLAEPKRVENFISAHYNSFQREGLRYAIEKMPKSLREHFLNCTHFTLENMPRS